MVTIDLERLTLEGLRSWAPDEPTAFTLEGWVNEMQLSLDGTLLSLHEPLRVTLNSRINDITIDRIARFVGPTGLEREGGSVDSEVHYDFTIHGDGRVEGTVDGVYNFADFEIATAAGETATLGKAVLQVDLEQERLADGSFAAAGRLRLEAAPVSFSDAAGDSMEVASLELIFGDLDPSERDSSPRRTQHRAPPSTRARRHELAVPAPGWRPRRRIQPRVNRADD